MFTKFVFTAKIFPADPDFIDKTDGTVDEEEEYLFPPYSTFTVRSVEVCANPFGVNEYSKAYHKIHLDVAPDNSSEDLELPLAPWA